MDINQLETFIENNQKDELVALLNEKPKLASQATSHQISPLLLACYYQKQDLASIIATFLPELTVFEACAIGKLDDVILLLSRNPELLDRYSNDGFTLIGLASYFNQSEIVKFLATNGADVNLPSNNGFNVFPIHSAVANNNLNLAKIILDAGAYPNVCQRSGVAPLHTAAQLGNIDLIILLLEHGADVSLRMEGGKLPSDLAAESGFAEIAAILRADD